MEWRGAGIPSKMCQLPNHSVKGGSGRVMFIDRCIEEMFARGLQLVLVS